MVSMKRATISGEALLLRNWTVPLMPLEVKQQLGIAPPPGQPGTM